VAIEITDTHFSRSVYAAPVNGFMKQRVGLLVINLSHPFSVGEEGPEIHLGAHVALRSRTAVPVRCRGIALLTALAFFKHVPHIVHSLNVTLKQGLALFPT